ncbi:MAG: hypothetical protein KatS3mg011_0365 [Acidimicrobiia bacterium]|nr:MAG: hypothetical protein KatS3mg011_0365 [Acidimicrobiia bacterium]
MSSLLLGASLGWAAGISPGPLTALLITTALRRGPAAGMRVALAPLVTDLPVVALGVAAAAALPDPVVVGMNLMGGVYLMWIGVAELRSSGPPPGPGGDLARGVVVNLLSPHPWLFWLTVGGPLLVEAWRTAPASAVGFLAGFYGLLVGTKLVMAGVVGWGGARLAVRWHHRLAWLGGAGMAGLGAYLSLRSLIPLFTAPGPAGPGRLPEVIWLILVAAAAVGVALIYNGLVRLRNRVDNAWGQVEVQLNRRHDLIPNLVETVKGYAAHEQSTFERVVEARNAATRASGPAEQAQAENMLTGALRQLFALAEAYPELRASENFQRLQQDLTDTENKIAVARQIYNDSVLTYNNRVQTVPSNLVAAIFGFRPREFFDAPEAADQAPTVQF